MKEKEPLLLLPPPGKPLQKRYYSLREIYRKYAIYSKKTGPEFYPELQRRMISIRQYLDWIKDKSLTIYTVSKKTIEEYIEYLFNHVRLGKGYYAKVTLCKKLVEIARFYSWLHQEGLIEKNIFDRAWYLNLRKYIKSRDRPTQNFKLTFEVPEEFQEAYEIALKMDYQRDFHERTIFEHKKGWTMFLQWLSRCDMKDLKQVKEKDLVEYGAYLDKVKSERTGHLLSACIRVRRLVAVKCLFNHLVCSGLVPRDPSYVIKLPKSHQAIPTTLMSRYEVEKILEIPDINTFVGIRDRTIMEVFYSSAVRRNELSHLKTEDILSQEGLLRVMVPKGGVAYQRVVPVGEVAMSWIRRYLHEVRPRFMSGIDHSYLFVNKRGGTPMRNHSLNNMIKTYCLKAGFRKPINSHSFRVTCATEMLRNRADIRYVQAHLGHRMIESTQIYARVLPTDLKKVHRRTHPREKRKKLTQLDQIL